MKLISKYKDYYDFFARDRSLSDQTYKWVRETKAVEINFALPGIVSGGNQFFFKRHDWRREIETTCFTVWFCGTPLAVAMVTRTDQSTLNRRTDYYHKFSDIPDDVKGERPKKPNESMYCRLESMFAIGHADGMPARKNRYEERLGVGRVLKSIPIVDMHRAVGSPVFCHPIGTQEHNGLIGEAVGLTEKGHAKKPCVIINPNLSEMLFWNRIDAFEAFKRLESFLANQMAPRDVRMDAPIPDVLKAQSKGFDNMSFRMEPGTKKRKNKTT